MSIKVYITAGHGLHYKCKYNDKIYLSLWVGKMLKKKIMKNVHNFSSWPENF